MPYTAEITERSLSRDRQAVLADVLVRELNVEPEEAELTALVMPALVGPFETAADRDAFLVALAESGFAARPADVPEVASPAYTPPAYTPPAQPAYAPPAVGPPVQPAVAPPPPEGYPPPAPVSSNNGLIIGIAVLLAVIAAALAVVVLTQGTRDAGEQPVAEDRPPVYEGSDAPAVDTMAVDTGETQALADTDVPGYSPPRQAPPRQAPRQQAPPAYTGGGVQTVRLRDGQISLRLSEGGQTWNMPRPLSPGTSVGNIQRVTLAGRNVVRFTAQDARWSTTYYWEYRQGLLHFVGTDGSRNNVSEAPGSQAIISADQGYVPSDDIVRGSGNASRAPARQTPRPAAPRRASRISTANVPNIIVMGSYAPGDEYGLNERYAQAQQTGLTLQVVPASTYGMNGNYRVIVAGPYEYATALRNLDLVRRYVPDAFRKALD